MHLIFTKKVSNDSQENVLYNYYKIVIIRQKFQCETCWFLQVTWPCIWKPWKSTCEWWITCYGHPAIFKDLMTAETFVQERIYTHSMVFTFNKNYSYPYNLHFRRSQKIVQSFNCRFDLHLRAITKFPTVLSPTFDPFSDACERNRKRIINLLFKSKQTQFINYGFTDFVC